MPTLWAAAVLKRVHAYETHDMSSSFFCMVATFHSSRSCNVPQCSAHYRGNNLLDCVSTRQNSPKWIHAVYLPSGRKCSGQCCGLYLCANPVVTSSTVRNKYIENIMNYRTVTRSYLSTSSRIQGRQNRSIQQRGRGFEQITVLLPWIGLIFNLFSSLPFLDTSQA